MNKYVIVSAGVLTLIDSFIKSTALNVTVFIVAGIAAIYFGFKFMKESKIGGAISLLIGILMVLFAFIKQLMSYGAPHVAIGIIFGLILIIAPFSKNFIKE